MTSAGSEENRKRIVPRPRPSLDPLPSSIFSRFLLRLTLHAQFREGHGFQSLFADFDAALRKYRRCLR